MVEWEILINKIINEIVDREREELESLLEASKLSVVVGDQKIYVENDKNQRIAFSLLKVFDEIDEFCRRKKLYDADIDEDDVIHEFVDQLEDIFYVHGFRFAECEGDDTIIYER
jgi:hypothetical protein